MSRPPWDLPDHELTPESAWWSRRALIRTLGLGGIGATLGGCDRLLGPPPQAAEPAYPLPEVPRSPVHRPGRELTEERWASSYNNYYELADDKHAPARLAPLLKTRPWTVEVTGLVASPLVLDIDALLARMPLQERAYRFRCVEAWAMTVPWTGFPLHALLALAKPLSAARFVRFTSHLDVPTMPGVRARPEAPWPYTEGLSMAEAMHDLTLMAVGIYGHGLPGQHGAPLRLVVPWKYGFKSAKAITRIELLAERPATFWNTLVPSEYDFTANVDPSTPHPRWSQATERLLPSGTRVPTLSFNGYADQVAHLYRT